MTSVDGITQVGNESEVNRKKRWSWVEGRTINRRKLSSYKTVDLNNFKTQYLSFVII